MNGIGQMAHSVGIYHSLVRAPSLFQCLVVAHHIVGNVGAIDGAAPGQIEGIGLAEQTDGFVIASYYREVAGIGYQVIGRRIRSQPMFLV